MFYIPSPLRLTYSVSLCEYIGIFWLYNDVEHNWDLKDYKMVVCFCYINFLLFKMYWRNLGRRPQHFLSKTNACQTHCLLFHMRPHFFLNMSMVKPVQIMWRNITSFRYFKCILFFTNVLIQTKINFFKDRKASLLSFKMISEYLCRCIFHSYMDTKKTLESFVY